MGHARLGTLPDTPRWRRVVGLLAEGAEVPVVADATMHAAERGLRLAAEDEGLRHTVWLLTQIGQAARREDLAAALRRAGVSVPSEPSVLDVVGGLSDAIDRHLHRTGRWTDIGEMAQLAAATPREGGVSALSQRREHLHAAW